MSIFATATRSKLRFQTERGFLSVEDLWDLPLTTLNAMAKGLRKLLKEDDEEDYLDEESVEDTETKLKFDIVLHILKTKKQENKDKRDATEKKAEREKILAILAKKQDDALENMSEDDLKAKLAALD